MNDLTKTSLFNRFAVGAGAATVAMVAAPSAFAQAAGGLGGAVSTAISGIGTDLMPIFLTLVGIGALFLAYSIFKRATSKG